MNDRLDLHAEEPATLEELFGEQLDKTVSADTIGTAACVSSAGGSIGTASTFGSA
jgi:hypothetical protein